MSYFDAYCDELHKLAADLTVEGRSLVPGLGRKKAVTWSDRVQDRTLARVFEKDMAAQGYDTTGLVEPGPMTVRYDRYKKKRAKGFLPSHKATYTYDAVKDRAKAEEYAKQRAAEGYRAAGHTSHTY